MSARFILSFDCEGRWGVADNLDAYRATLTDGVLRETYARLLGLLDASHIAATFAFVGCFMLPRDRLMRLPLRELAQELPYLAPIVAELSAGAEGWVGDWAVELAARSHEIGLHGVTHTPWTGMTEAQARREMGLMTLPEAATFVFPRNKVAHRAVLAEFGIAGFRSERAFPSRLRAFLSEWNIWERPEGDPPPGRVLEIPAGFFINWQSGLRRAVPLEITRQRIRRLLKAAVEQNAVVHFWSHPENFASAPRTFDVLSALLAEVSALRERGDLIVQTQKQYCEARQAAQGSASP